MTAKKKEKQPVETQTGRLPLFSLLKAESPEFMPQGIDTTSNEAYQEIYKDVPMDFAQCQYIPSNLIPSGSSDDVYSAVKALSEKIVKSSGTRPKHLFLINRTQHPYGVSERYNTTGIVNIRQDLPFMEGFAPDSPVTFARIPLLKGSRITVHKPGGEKYNALCYRIINVDLERRTVGNNIETLTEPMFIASRFAFGGYYVYLVSRTFRTSEFDAVPLFSELLNRLHIISQSNGSDLSYELCPVKSNDVLIEQSMSYFNGIEDRLKQELSELSNSYDMSVADSITLAKQMAEKQQAIAVVPETLKSMREQIKNSLAIDRVDFLYVSGSVLNIFTKHVFIDVPSHKKRYDIGKFKITVNLDTGKIGLSNLTRKVVAFRGNASDHPHDMGGDDSNICWGEIKEYLPKLVSSRRIAALVNILVNFCWSVNLGDPAGRTISEWPSTELVA